ncbi:MAG: PqqD family protein [bacterium]|jgi:hypothetical protein|nr:PqqD family protein [bacterium]
MSQKDYLIKAREDVAWRAIEGQAVIVDGRFDKVHTLNPVATTVWKKIQDEINFDRLVLELGEKYEAAKSVLMKDVRELVDRFQEEQLLTGSFHDTP